MCRVRGALVIFVAFFISPFVGEEQSAPSRLKVCLHDGCVQGKTESGNVRGYDAWYGIPFATPPLGQLRFKSPIPPPSWNFLWDATFARNACMQVDLLTQKISGSEDCLYLNVYRPTLASRKKLLPVLVFIHGGSYKLGSADPNLYGPDYLMDTQEVIVVTIQYRLGAFGFLASDDENCKGNFGLKDQNMALRWIAGNIRGFGGDPDQVTLMGQSAGAASVQYQMISKRSDGLFHRAIMSSGSALAFWALNLNPLAQFRHFAAIAGINKAQSEDTAKIIDSLREKTALELMESQEQMFVLHNVISVFRPVVEGKWRGAFIRRRPEEIWESGQYEHRPFLTGVTGYEEGSFADLFYNQAVRQQILSSPDYNIAYALEYPLAAVGPILDHYFGGKVSEENIINLLRLRDRFNDYPMYKTVEFYTQYANVRKYPVDLYHFNFTAKFSLAALTNPFPIEERGASHMDELLYLFRFKYFDPLFNRGQAELEMKDYFVRFIVDYVKHGMGNNYLVRGCTRKAMDKGFCEYLNIQRDYSQTPNKVKISVSNNIDLGMVESMKAADRLSAKLEKHDNLGSKKHRN